MIKIFSYRNINKQELNYKFFYLGTNTKNILNTNEIRLPIKSLSKERNNLLSKIKSELINLDKNIIDVCDPIWLSSDLAENNLCLENFSLYILNTLIIARNIIPNYEKVVFICDDAEQVFIYSSLLKKNGLVVDAKLEYYKLLKRLTGCLYQKIKYLFIYAYNIIYLRFSRFINRIPIKKQELSNADLICVNWVNEQSFEKNNLYVSDRYFGSLLSTLSKIGLKVPIVGKTLDFSNSFSSILKSAIRTKEPFYLLQDFLKLTDLVKIFIKSFTFFKFSKTPFIIDGFDFSFLWKWECLKDSLKFRIPHALSAYSAAMNIFKNIKNSELKILYPYENQPWEKTLNLAFKKIFPDGQSYAYQHFPIAQNYLTSYYSDNFIKKRLYPRILLSDHFFGEQLKKNGFKDFDLLGNYRLNQSLQGHKKTEKLHNNKIILCACSIQLNDSLELVSKAIKIINAIPPVVQKEINFIVNFHPYMQESQKNIIKDMLVLSKVKAVVSPLSADEILSDALLVFYNSNSICFNAAAKGIPAVFIPSDLQIDLDRMPKVSIKAESIEKTAKIVEKLLTNQIFYKEQSDKFQSYFDKYFIAPQFREINNIFNSEK
jgi:hypothetical protein